jgi:hypothetical protein
MKPPRPRLCIWLLMLVVALVALGSAVAVLAPRSTEYLHIARVHEGRAGNFRERAAAYRKLIRDGSRSASLTLNQTTALLTRKALEAEDDARIEDTNAALYRRAARFPWLGPPQKSADSE